MADVLWLLDELRSAGNGASDVDLVVQAFCADTQHSARRLRLIELVRYVLPRLARDKLVETCTVLLNHALAATTPDEQPADTLDAGDDADAAPHERQTEAHVLFRAIVDLVLGDAAALLLPQTDDIRTLVVSPTLQVLRAAASGQACACAWSLHAALALAEEMCVYFSCDAALLAHVLRELRRAVLPLLRHSSFARRRVLATLFTPLYGELDAAERAELLPQLWSTALALHADRADAHAQADSYALVCYIMRCIYFVRHTGTTIASELDPPDEAELLRQMLGARRLHADRRDAARGKQPAAAAAAAARELHIVARLAALAVLDLRREQAFWGLVLCGMNAAQRQTRRRAAYLVHSCVDLTIAELAAGPAQPDRPWTEHFAVPAGASADAVAAPYKVLFSLLDSLDEQNGHQICDMWADRIGRAIALLHDDWLRAILRRACTHDHFKVARAALTTLGELPPERLLRLCAGPDGRFELLFDAVLSLALNHPQLHSLELRLNATGRGALRMLRSLDAALADDDPRRALLFSGLASLLRRASLTEHVLRLIVFALAAARPSAVWGVHELSCVREGTLMLMYGTFFLRPYFARALLLATLNLSQADVGVDALVLTLAGALAETEGCAPPDAAAASQRLLSLPAIRVGLAHTLEAALAAPAHGECEAAALALGAGRADGLALLLACLADPAERVAHLARMCAPLERCYRDAYLAPVVIWRAQQLLAACARRWAHAGEIAAALGRIAEPVLAYNCAALTLPPGVGLGCASADELAMALAAQRARAACECVEAMAAALPAPQTALLSSAHAWIPQLAARLVAETAAGRAAADPPPRHATQILCDAELLAVLLPLVARSAASYGECGAAALEAVLASAPAKGSFAGVWLDCEYRLLVVRAGRAKWSAVHAALYEARRAGVTVAPAAMRRVFDTCVDELGAAGLANLDVMLQTLRLVLVPALAQDGGGWDAAALQRALAASYVVLDENAHQNIGYLLSLHIRCVMQAPLLCSASLQPMLVDWMLATAVRCHRATGAINVLAATCVGFWRAHPLEAQAYVSVAVALAKFGMETTANEAAGFGTTDAALRAVAEYERVADGGAWTPLVFTADNTYTRGVLGIFLAQLQPQSSSAARALVSSLFGALLDALAGDDVATAKRSMTDGPAHRGRFFLAQALAVLVPHLAQLEGAPHAYSVRLAEAHAHLCPGDVRLVLDIVMCNWVAAFPDELERYLERLERLDWTPQYIQSLVTIAMQGVRHVRGVEEATRVRLLARALGAVIPLCASHHYVVRTVAHIGFYALHALATERGLVASLFGDSLLLERLRANLYSLVAASDNDKHRAKFLHVLTFEPVAQYSLALVYFEPLHHYGPLRSSAVPLRTLRLLEAGTSAAQAFAIDRLPSADDELSTDWGTADEPEANASVREADEAATMVAEPAPAAESALNFQQKMQPWDAITAGLATHALTRLGSFETRQRHELIVVATLVDRPSNLGGLCRTAEIFNACKLVVPSAEVLQDRMFQALAVASDHWMPTEVVPPANLRDYLYSLRRAGYVLVGAEQTAESVRLDRFVFPERTALVLGAEREGMPVDIIALMDACVEIPQFGLTRSLNVHVSGAICTWEYARQAIGRAERRSRAAGVDALPPSK